MYCLKTEHSFDSAHFLQGYEGKCRNIHGHRWTVEIIIEGEQLIAEGEKREMLIDFGDLKRDLREEADALDHALIIEEGSLKEKTLEALLEEGFRILQFPFRPTAEQFARYFYEQMTKKGYQVQQAVVYETPNNCAVYSGPVRREDGRV